MTTVDQATGVVGQEPLPTLATFRSGRVLSWQPPGEEGWANGARACVRTAVSLKRPLSPADPPNCGAADVFMGWNLVPLQERDATAARTISVGDAVTVHSTRKWADFCRTAAA